eukprot:10732477-Lingulodinium_polyedra.AAC.1
MAVSAILLSQLSTQTPLRCRRSNTPRQTLLRTRVRPLLHLQTRLSTENISQRNTVAAMWPATGGWSPPCST